MTGLARWILRRLELRRIMPHGFFGRALIIVAAPLVFLQLILAGIFYEEHWEEVGRQLAFHFANQVGSVSRQIVVAPEDVEGILLRSSAAYDARFSFEEGAALPGERFHPADSYLDHALDRMLPHRVRYPYRYDTRSLDDEVKLEVGLPTGVLTVVVPFDHVSSSTTNLFISLMVSASALVFILAVYFLRRQVWPLRAVARATERFGRGDVHAPLVPRGAAEVRQVAQAFLTMRERLRAQIEQRTEMLAGVSHDLRTPITRLRLQLEMLGDESARRSMETDLHEMEQMIEAYLAFARGEGEEQLSEADLGAMAGDVVRRGRAQAPGLELGACEGLAAQVRPGAIRRALVNLIDNACRAGRRVRVGVRRDGDMAEITVEDDGPGIPPGDREEAFRPFRKLDGGAGGGVGIGLSVARDIVRGHGGEIEFGDSPLGGLRAAIRIPL